MAYPTPHHLPLTEPTIYRDERTLDGHVIFTLTTSCGHSAEVATVNAVWLEQHPEVESELWVSLSTACRPGGSGTNCISCPFSLRLVG